MEQKVLTVKDLIKELKEADEAGFGDSEVLLSFDDEWNGFRNLWSSQITLINDDDTIEKVLGLNDLPSKDILANLLSESPLV